MVTVTDLTRKLLRLSAFFLIFCTVDIMAAGDAGKAAYKKANCIGCHKWHGDGGGGYGGLALSLRKTALTRAELEMLIRCGRPGTRMPYHDRKAYRGDDRSCYESSKEELGDSMPPRAPSFLRDREITAVVDYVVENIQGKGPPDHADCVAFWGENARRCNSLKKQQSKQAN